MTPQTGSDLIIRGARWAAAIIAAATLLVAGAKAAAPPPPRRIVSLVPSITEMLYAIGAGSRVVGVSSFDHFPADVENLPRVGALIDPDIEKVLSLRPDLVVTYGSQSDFSDKLASAGIQTFTYRHTSLAGIPETIRQIGSRLGLEAGSSALAAKLEHDLNAVRDRAKGSRRPRTMIVIGREPRSLRSINVSGGVGFLHDLAELAGADNIFSAVPRESILVTTETILARAPELILELHYTEAPSAALVDAEKGAWARLSAVPAVKANRVVLLFGEELVLPGPRVVETARVFARAIHPELTQTPR